MVKAFCAYGETSLRIWRKLAARMVAAHQAYAPADFAITLGFGLRADVAQLVEHLHGKEGVRGSSPRVGLPKNRITKLFFEGLKIGAIFSGLLGQVRNNAARGRRMRSGPGGDARMPRSMSAAPRHVGWWLAVAAAPLGCAIGARPA
jgi:hypothetical protein